MATAARAAGTAYQSASAARTSSPHTMPDAAVTMTTDMTLSTRSTVTARRPDRVRTAHTTTAITSRPVVVTAAALTHDGTAYPVATPKTMAHPMAYIRMTATNQSHQHQLSGRGARRAARYVNSRAGVVYAPLARTANTTT